jgi:NAD(P)-dependent dehydrogenase (short-subunit alcohol dehydrogenase family)
MDFTVDLEGQVAVVTGATGGIGRAVALQLASSGADVAVTDLHQRVEPLCDLASEISQLGRKSIAISADVTDRTDIDHLIGDVLNAFGAVDLLVNVAGVYLTDRISDYSEIAWDRTMSVNLKGPFLTCQAFSKVMSEQRQGNIINIASDSAIDVAEGDGPYASSKSALVTLTRHIAREMGQHNIRANVIAPGWVKTEMTRFVWSDPKLREEAESGVPLGFLAEPEDIGSVALFLASDASRYINGQLIVANGGRV